MTMVKLEEKKTVLTQIKKAFETLVANFDKGDEANTSFWGRRYSRRDGYGKTFGEELTLSDDVIYYFIDPHGVVGVNVMKVHFNTSGVK